MKANTSKRRSWFISMLSLLLCASMLLSIPVYAEDADSGDPVQYDENVEWFNYDFETWTDGKPGDGKGWSYTYCDAEEAKASDPLEPNNTVLRVYRPKAGYALLGFSGAFLAGHTYTVKAKALSGSDLTSRPTIKIERYYDSSVPDKSDDGTVGYVNQGTVAVNANAWTDIEFTFKPNHNLSKVNFLLRMLDSDGGTVYFDDFSVTGPKEHEHATRNLTKVNARKATPDAPGNIEHWKCTCGNLYLDANGEKATDSVYVTIPKGVEFIADGGFEDNSGKWTVWTENNTYRGKIVEGGHNESNNAYEVTSNTEKGVFGQQSNIMGLIPGETYTYTGYVYIEEKPEGLKDGDVRARIVYEQDGEKTADCYLGDALKGGQWVPFKFEWTTPDVNITNVRVRLHTVATDKNVVVLFDDISLVGPAALCQGTINGVTKYYSTLEDAIAAAANGGTIQLLSNVTTENALTINPGVTLDLNGYDLNTVGITVFDGGKLIDSAATKGRLVTSFLGMPEGNNDNYVPVNTGEEYILTKVKVDQIKDPAINSAGQLEVVFRPGFGKDGDTSIASEYVINDNNVKIRLKLTWTDSNGNEYSQTFECNDQLVQSVYTKNKAFALRITGFDGIQTLTARMIVAYDNVEVASEEKHWTSTSQS